MSPSDTFFADLCGAAENKHAIVSDYGHNDGAGLVLQQLASTRGLLTFKNLVRL